MGSLLGRSWQCSSSTRLYGNLGWRTSRWPPWAFSDFSFFPARPLTYEEPIPGITGCGPLSILATNVIYFSIVGLVVLNTGHHVLAPLRWRPLRYIGQVSYGLYLYHFLVIESLHKYFGPRSLTTDLAAAVLSVLAGVISWECLEKPIGNLKRWFPYENPGLASDRPRTCFRTCSPPDVDAPLKKGRGLRKTRTGKTQPVIAI